MDILPRTVSIRFWLHQRGRLTGGQAETGERPFSRRRPGVHQAHLLHPLPANENLDKLVASHLSRPPKSGIKVKVVDLQYQAKSWHKPRRVVAKIEWHHFKKQEELLP